MAGKVKLIKIDTREARARLEARGQPYYIELLNGLHLGYRKGLRRSRWVTRRWVGDAYIVTTLDGVVDDAERADGERILSFDEARRTALKLAGEAAKQAKADKGNALRRRAKTTPYLVRDAIDDYVAFLARERKSARKSRSLADGAIIPELGDTPVRDLTRDALADWLRALADSPRRVRGGKEQPPPANEEERRKRRASANRVWTVLSAALNMAFADGRVDSDAAWRRVRPLREANAPSQRWLSNDEMKRLVAAAGEPLKSLVVAALHSGCRLGELCRLEIADFDARAGSLLVRVSKTGRHRNIVLTDEAVDFFDRLTKGRAPHEVMLRRADGRAWVPGSQDRLLRIACERAGIARAHFHSLRHTFASHSAMDGMPTLQIARALGHSTTAQVERCYAHLCPTGMRETVRSLRKPLGLDSDDGDTLAGR